MECFTTDLAVHAPLVLLKACCCLRRSPRRPSSPGIIVATHAQGAGEPALSALAKARLQARVAPAAFADELRRTVRPPASWTAFSPPSSARPGAADSEADTVFQQATETLAGWTYPSFVRVRARDGLLRWNRRAMTRTAGDPCNREPGTLLGRHAAWHPGAPGAAKLRVFRAAMAGGRRARVLSENGDYAR